MRDHLRQRRDQIPEESSLTPVSPQTASEQHAGPGETSQSQGQTLSSETRNKMEPLFGHNLSSIRIYADPGAASAARSIDARAYTVGSDIYFNDGQYAPETPQGDQLLAHEIAHTVQQSKSGTAGRNADGPPRISRSGDPHEQEARDAAALVSQGYSVGSAQLSAIGTDAIAVQRVPGTDAAAEVAPPAPTSYNPPPELASAMMPADAQIVAIDTVGIGRALRNEIKWVSGLKDDMTWGGWGALADLTSQSFWTGPNLADATSGMGLIVPLPVWEQDYPGGYLHSSIEILATVGNVRFDAADGVGISQSSAGGAGVSNSTQFNSTTTVGGEAGLTGTPKGGPGEVGGKVSASSAKGTQTTGGSARAGGLTVATATVAGVRFKFDVDWAITVHQKYDVGTGTTILNMGSMNIAHWIADKPKQTVNISTKNALVRFPQVRCEPVTPK